MDKDRFNGRSHEPDSGLYVLVCTTVFSGNVRVWKRKQDEEIQIIRKELNDLSLEKPDMDSFNQLLNKEDSNLDTSLIMYAEQLARKDVEINSLRSKRKELEGRVRQG